MSINKTIVFVEAGKVAVEDREIPVPAEGQLLIRTGRTLISTGTELTILNADFPPGSAWDTYGSFPFVPGYDNVGEVIETGPGVDAAWQGKKVISYGVHAQYVCVAEGDAQEIQVNIPDEEAVFFTISEIVLNGIRRSGITFGEAAVVFGQGLLGQFATRYCRLHGARPTFAVDVAPARLALLQDDPGIIVVNAAEQKAVEIVKKHTRGRLADVVVELTGNGRLIPGEFEVLRPQGRFVVLSSPHDRTDFDFHDLCNAQSFTIIGAHNSSHPAPGTGDRPWTKPRHRELFFDLAADGELDVKKLISHRAHFEEAPELYAMLVEDRSQAMGVVLEWD
ncbi:zinc-binding dehydrogenase [Planctomycetota bacterium]